MWSVLHNRLVTNESCLGITKDFQFSHLASPPRARRRWGRGVIGEKIYHYSALLHQTTTIGIRTQASKREQQYNTIQYSTTTEGTTFYHRASVILVQTLDLHLLLSTKPATKAKTTELVQYILKYTIVTERQKSPPPAINSYSTLVQAGKYTSIIIK